MWLLLYLYILLWKVASQGVSIPASATGTSSAIPSTGIEFCSACYAVAPIDQEIQGVQADYSFGLGPFTWNLGGVFTGNTDGPSLVALPTASEITFSTFQVINPTMYIVFKSYEVVALSGADGPCSSTTLLQNFLNPLSLLIPSGASSGIIRQAESVFIHQLPGITCSTGPNGVVVTTTITSSTTGLARPSSLSETTVQAVSTSSLSLLLPPGYISLSAGTLTLNVSSTSLPTSSNSTSNTGSIPTTTVPTNNSLATNSSATGNNSGLSQSEKIGLGAGLGIAGAVILVIIGVIMRRYGMRKRRASKEPYRMVELSSKEPDAMVEMSSNQHSSQAELENNLQPQELSAERRAELEANKILRRSSV